MSLIAYIPARGGSKRLPRKNVRKLGQKPVLVHVIEAIHASGLTDKICVSTDDPKTARVANRAGAVVLGLRADRLSDDKTTFLDLFKKDVPRYLEHFHMQKGETSVLFALATAALVQAKVYRLAFKEFKKRNASVLVATDCLSPSLFPDQMSAARRLPDLQVDAGLFYFLDYTKMSRQKVHWFCVRKGLICFPVSSPALPWRLIF